MRICYQWAQKDPQPWQAIDSSLIASLPSRSAPKSGQIGGKNNQEGWLANVSVQGITCEGYDHVAIEPVTVGLEQGEKLTVWNDDPDDYAAEDFHAIVWTIPPLAPDANLGGAINTRQSCIWYCDGDRYAKLSAQPPQNTTIRPWSEFVAPPEAVTRHGVWLDDAKWNEHVATAPQAEWSWMHAVEHLPDIETEMAPDGRRILKEQRAQGRWQKAKGTITYYQMVEDSGLSGSGYTHEDYLKTTTTTSGTESVTTDANPTNCWRFTTETNQPNSADWPNGDYHNQVNCTAASAGLVYGVGTFLRVDSTGSVEQSVAPDNGDGDADDFSGTGLKLSTVTWDPSAGAAGDRYETRIKADGDGHGDAITLTLNTTDSYADGPWSAAVAVTAEYGLHAIERAAVAGINTASRLGGWMEY